MSNEKKALAAHHEHADPASLAYDERRRMSAAEIQDAVRSGSVPKINEGEAKEIAKHGGWEVDALINSLKSEDEQTPRRKGMFDIQFKNPKHFTWLLVAFASMGGLLSGLDQSLISGANLYLPRDLGLSPAQNSLVNSGMPLGAVGGALLLSPTNEYLGRRMAIIISCILYTIGAALEAGSINYGMIIAARVILGLGVGLEGGTVPVYVAETVERRLRGNMVSLYQFNIALGEVLGYAVAAIFIKVPGNWRYILGSSLVFSTIMFAGMLFLPESPRYLIHRGKTLEAFRVWKRVRGINTADSREEFFVMKVSLEEEEAAIQAGSTRRFPWMDFFTVPRARRAITVANIIVFLGQFTGINAILYYLSVLFHSLGYDPITSNYLSLVGGGSLLLGTIPAIFLMERVGRRYIANVTMPLFFVGLILVGVSYLLTDFQSKQGVYLTGLIIYEFFFGSYACLTWVIPSEVYPTYLRSYGMTTSDGWLFLSSFIVTYNFDGMKNAMKPTGLTLGFYGGIAVLGWFWQLFFLPETKDKTLEEIDEIFERPTMDIVRENAREVMQTTRDLCHLRFRKVFWNFEPARQNVHDATTTKETRIA